MTSELLLTSSLEEYIKSVCPIILFLVSTLTRVLSALYGIIHQQYGRIEQTLEACLREIIDTRWVPPTSRGAIRIVKIHEIFGAVISLLNE